MKIAIVRGKHLNRYEMQFYEPLVKKYQLVGFGSLHPFHDRFSFPVVKLHSPMDWPSFPYKMPILNRLFVDAQYLYGLEENLKGFDLAHSAETYLHFTQQCLKAKKKGWVKKVVVTVFENIPFANEGIWGRKRYKKKAIKEVDHFIAISDRAKEALILEGCEAEKITVINQHIDCQRFKPAKNNNKKLNILFVGRLEAYKGVYELIYAAKKLLNTFDLQFSLIGEGSQKKRLQKLTKRLGISKNFIFKAVTYDKMPLEYQKADIFVAPSKATSHWQEQFSTVLLEAQASGLPIVTTRSGAIEENTGPAALYANPGDFQSLAQGLTKLISYPDFRQELGRKARKRAVEKFDIKLGAQKLAEVYEKVNHNHR